jgi:excisionase family DNA binding protein
MNTVELAALMLIANDPVVERDLRAVLARHAGRQRPADDEQPPVPPDLMPLKEWAKLVGKSAQTVRRWIRDGQVPGARSLPGRGGDYLIPRDALPVAEIAKPAGSTATLADLSYVRARGQ